MINQILRSIVILGCLFSLSCTLYESDARKKLEEEAFTLAASNSSSSLNNCGVNKNSNFLLQDSEWVSNFSQVNVDLYDGEKAALVAKWVEKKSLLAYCQLSDNIDLNHEIQLNETVITFNQLVEEHLR